MKLKEIRQLRTFRKQSDFRESHFRDSPKRCLLDFDHHFVALKEPLISLIAQSLRYYAGLQSFDLDLVLG